MTNSDADALCVVLDGDPVSWQRPKAKPGFIATKYGRRPRVGYSADYEAGRLRWSLVVIGAVKEREWTVTKGERYGVRIVIHATGRLDSDRVVSAVLDALQSGGAIHDDCSVDQGSWVRHRGVAAQMTQVWVWKLPV